MNEKIDKIKRYYRQFKMFSIRDGWKKANYLRKKNIFYHIGNKCYYNPNILPAEPFLVCLHDNVVISAGVRLITHSAVHAVFNEEEKNKKYVCRHGKIEIHSNVYIGANAIINYGVTIGSNCIIAAGAIVTKDIPSGSVVAGIPAKVIGTYNQVKEKNKQFSEIFDNMKETKTVMNMLTIKPISFDIDQNGGKNEK